MTVLRGLDGRFLSPKMREALARGRSPDLTAEQLREARAPMPALSAVSSTLVVPKPACGDMDGRRVEGIAVRAIPLQRAVAGEQKHRHFRLDGEGVVEHQHPVRSERHGHPASGLALIGLAWSVWEWRRLGGFVLYVGTVAVYVGLALMALIGWWFFARSV